MNAANGKSEKVIWAIDRSDDQNNDQAGEVALQIRQMCQQNFEIQPFYVRSGTKVEDLSRFAEKEGAAFIVASARESSLIDRVGIGSFVEGLVNHATCPLLVLPVGLSFSANIFQDHPRVLFATDFSPQSRLSFRAFLALTRHLHLEIKVFNVATLPATALISADGIPTMIPENFFSEELMDARKVAAHWVSLAKNSGVVVETEILDGGVGANISGLVLEASVRFKAAWIVLSSARGLAGAVLLGSTTREILRLSQGPLWLYGPKAHRRSLGVATDSQESPSPTV